MKAIPRDNELIAKFDGWIKSKENIWHKGSEWIHTSENFKYHESWDWLMPVVEKINNTWSQYANENKLEPDNYPLEITMMRINIAWVKIGKVYQSVIEFIKWYNENKKSA